MFHGAPATSSSSSFSLELPMPSHNEYTWIAPQKQLTCREDGKSNLTAGPGGQIAFPLGGRKVSVSPPPRPRIRWRERSKWLQGCTALQVKSHPFPPILSSSRLTFPSLRTHFDTSDQSPGDTGAPHSSLSSSSNNYGDRVALSAKLGPLGSQQHIVQPD